MANNDTEFQEAIETETPSYNSLFDVISKILGEPYLGRLVLFFRGEWLNNDISIDVNQSGDASESFAKLQKQRKETFEGGVIALFLKFRKHNESRFVESAKKSIGVEELGDKSDRYDIFLIYIYRRYILTTTNSLSDVETYQKVMRDIRLVAIHRDYENLTYLQES